MKPFNLEEYLKNPSKKVVTRDGRSVKIHCTNYTRAQHIIAQIEGKDYASSFNKDGIFINGVESNCDLFFAPEKREGWVNIYRDTILSESPFIKFIYPSEAEAKRNACFGVMATAKIEWEE